jgi:cytochrome c peroxidase
MDTCIECHVPCGACSSAAMRAFSTAVAWCSRLTAARKRRDGEAGRVVPIAALGRMLFFDRALSADGQVSCATCHHPERAYSVGLALASGVAGQRGTRNTKTGVTFGKASSSLGGQGDYVIFNRMVDGNPTHVLWARVRADGTSYFYDPQVARKVAASAVGPFQAYPIISR